MNRAAAVVLLVASFLAGAAPASATRVRVVHRGPRATVRVSVGFPLHRPLPHVVVRRPAVTFRVAPRIYLPHVAFGAVVVAAPATDRIVWSDAESLAREDNWSEIAMDVDRRGDRLLLDITEGPAQLSFAEVVFENGETQVVDFNDGVQKIGIYSLLDFGNGRKVDHVRLVAKASGKETRVAVRLVG